MTVTIEDGELINQALCNIVRLATGAFGALLMVVFGLASTVLGIALLVKIFSINWRWGLGIILPSFIGPLVSFFVLLGAVKLGWSLSSASSIMPSPVGLGAGLSLAIKLVGPVVFFTFLVKHWVLVRKTARIYFVSLAITLGLFILRAALAGIC